IFDYDEIAQRLKPQPFAIIDDVFDAGSAGPARAAVHHHGARTAHADAAGEAIGQRGVVLALDFGDHVEHGLMFAARQGKGLKMPGLVAAPDIDPQRGIGHRCMPHRLTVRASMARKITDSTNRPIRMTVSRPENTVAVSRSLRASKMYQPMPPERDETPNTSSAATNVRQAKAQPILRPARIEGNAAGIRINPT